GALDNLSTDEVKVRVMHSAVGGITESDIILANSSGGLVLGFNVRANPQAREMANRDDVDIRYYSIIYNVIDDMKQLMEGLLAPEIRERQIGYAEVRDVFSVSRAGKAAGCMVTEGLFKRGNKVRLLRDDVVIFEGSLKSLRRFKDDVREVQQGYECGMAFENYDDIKEGDVIECFEAEEIARSL
ncbi:MAG: EF-Tu/IF-2/RF-3 family GTPase, partial [Pseudomonadota bacterium]|nr:EF-Tu/IF-2/RF-3 family GTPase [Pseudomonadota bacterium]